MEQKYTTYGNFEIIIIFLGQFFEKLDEWLESVRYIDTFHLYGKYIKDM